MALTDEDKLAATSDDSAIVAECRQFMQISAAADSNNRADGLAALAFLAGDQWDPQARDQRRLQMRPCLTINKLPTFLHQLTNDQRQNVPSIKVHPAEDGDVDTAEVMQGLIRHIEYSSGADACYDTAVNSAAAVGFGYFRLVTQYCDEKSFDQDIVFKRIRNAFTVYYDPAAVEPDGSDQTKCAISVKMPRTEFKRQYPDAQASQDDFIRGLGDQGDWLNDSTVRVTEYYRVKMTTATLCRLSNGAIGWKDELPKEGTPERELFDAQGLEIVEERKSAKRTIEWFKLNAVEVLERSEVMCRWIPVFPVFGDEYDLDGKVIRQGIVKNAMDPAKMYNVWMTAATEEVAMRPKAKYIMAEGQEEGHEDEWAAANNSSSPYITYRPTALNGTPVPPPQRQPLADVPAGMLTMAQHASDDIKATTGYFDASLGARGNETSGRAILARQREGDVANFHYTDNLNRTIRHVGRCIVDMIPHYYDAERVVRIMGEDESVKSVPINKPIQPKKDPKTGAIKTVLNDLTVGKYDIVIGTGPQYTTLRQEAAAAMVEFGKNWPKLMDVAGDKVVKAMDWPGAEEIAERIKKTIPPELTQDEDEGQPEIPAQVRQVIAQMEQVIQAQEQALQEAQSGAEKARIDAAAKIEVAQINATSSLDVQELKSAVEMLMQKLAPPPALADAATTEGDGGDKQSQILEQLLQQLVAQSAPKPSPKRRMSITAPSGQIYTGEIMDDTGPEPGEVMQ